MADYSEDYDNNNDDIIFKFGRIYIQFSMCQSFTQIILEYFPTPVEESGSRTCQPLGFQRRTCQQLWVHLQQIQTQREMGPKKMSLQAPFQLLESPHLAGSLTVTKHMTSVRQIYSNCG